MSGMFFETQCITEIPLIYKNSVEKGKFRGSAQNFVARRKLGHRCNICFS